MTSRDTEIERIAAVLADPTVMRRLLYERLDAAAAALYDAGLRSQPGLGKSATSLTASEPSLDVAAAQALLYWYDHTHGNEFGHDHHCRGPWGYEIAHTDAALAEGCSCGWTDFLKADRLRLSQPADNEAAE